MEGEKQWVPPSSIGGNHIVTIPSQQSEKNGISIENEHGSEIRVAVKSATSKRKRSWSGLSEYVHRIAFKAFYPWSLINIEVVTWIHGDIGKNLT